MPKAVAVLRKHLESDRPDAWRPAVKVLEYAWGVPSNQAESPADPAEVIDLRTLSAAQLAAMRDRSQRRVLRAARLASGWTPSYGNHFRAHAGDHH